MSGCKKSCGDLEAGRNNSIILEFDTPLTSWFQMFQFQNHIKDVDLSECDASQVKSMSQMFQDCSKLQKVDFGNIDVSSIETMHFSFIGCSSLTSIDFSNLVFSKLNDMIRTFQGCSSLVSVNLKNVSHFANPVMELELLLIIIVKNVYLIIDF